LPVMFVV